MILFLQEAEAQAAEAKAALERQISLEQAAVLEPSDSDGLGGLFKLTFSF